MMDSIKKLKRVESYGKPLDPNLRGQIIAELTALRIYMHALRTVKQGMLTFAEGTEIEGNVGRILAACDKGLRDALKAAEERV